MSYEASILTSIQPFIASSAAIMPSDSIPDKYGISACGILCCELHKAKDSRSCNMTSPYTDSFTLIPDEHIICFISTQHDTITWAGTFTHPVTMNIDIAQRCFMLLFTPEQFVSSTGILPSALTNHIITSDYNRLSAEYGSSGHLPAQLAYMLEQIRSSSGSVQIAMLADEFNYSSRHITRLFTGYLGYNCKTACRIARLHGALNELHKKPDRSNTEFIQNLNYSDQAHFQREFKEFMGVTPRQYIKYYRECESFLMY